MFFATAAAAAPCSASAVLRYVFFVFDIIILLYTEFVMKVYVVCRNLKGKTRNY